MFSLVMIVYSGEGMRVGVLVVAGLLFPKRCKARDSKTVQGLGKDLIIMTDYGVKLGEGWGQSYSCMINGLEILWGGNNCRSLVPKRMSRKIEIVVREWKV